MTKRDVSKTGTGGNGAWPSFAPGHTASVKSGARSPRVYGELAQHLAAGLTQDRPDLGAYPEAVAAWATAEARAALARRYIAEAGWIDPDKGEPRDGALKWLQAFEGLAAKHRSTLGLDPRSEAALARERAAAAVLTVDLDGLAERGRAALAEREAAGIAPSTDVAGQVLATVQAKGAEVMAEASERHYREGLSRPPEERPNAGQPARPRDTDDNAEDGSR